MDRASIAALATSNTSVVSSTGSSPLSTAASSKRLLESPTNTKGRPSAALSSPPLHSDTLVACERHTATSGGMGFSGDNKAGHSSASRGSAAEGPSTAVNGSSLASVIHQGPLKRRSVGASHEVEREGSGESLRGTRGEAEAPHVGEVRSPSGPSAPSSSLAKCTSEDAKDHSAGSYATVSGLYSTEMVAGNAALGGGRGGGARFRGDIHSHNDSVTAAPPPPAIVHRYEGFALGSNSSIVVGGGEITYPPLPEQGMRSLQHDYQSVPAANNSALPSNNSQRRQPTATATAVAGYSPTLVATRTTSSIFTTPAADLVGISAGNRPAIATGVGSRVALSGDYTGLDEEDDEYAVEGDGDETEGAPAPRRKHWSPTAHLRSIRGGFTFEDPMLAPNTKGGGAVVRSQSQGSASVSFSNANNSIMSALASPNVLMPASSGAAGGGGGGGGEGRQHSSAALSRRGLSTGSFYGGMGGFFGTNPTSPSSSLQLNPRHFLTNATSYSQGGGTAFTATAAEARHRRQLSLPFASVAAQHSTRNIMASSTSQLPFLRHSYSKSNLFAGNTNSTLSTRQPSFRRRTHAHSHASHFYPSPNALESPTFLMGADVGMMASSHRCGSPSSLSRIGRAGSGGGGGGGNALGARTAVSGGAQSPIGHGAGVGSLYPPPPGSNTASNNMSPSNSMSITGGTGVYGGLSASNKLDVVALSLKGGGLNTSTSSAMSPSSGGRAVPLHTWQGLDGGLKRVASSVRSATLPAHSSPLSHTNNSSTLEHREEGAVVIEGDALHSVVTKGSHHQAMSSSGAPFVDGAISPRRQVSSCANSTSNKVRIMTPTEEEAMVRGPIGLRRRGTTVSSNAEQLVVIGTRIDVENEEGEAYHQQQGSSLGIGGPHMETSEIFFKSRTTPSPSSKKSEGAGEHHVFTSLRTLPIVAFDDASDALDFPQAVWNAVRNRPAMMLTVFLSDLYQMLRPPQQQSYYPYEDQQQHTTTTPSLGRGPDANVRASDDIGSVMRSFGPSPSVIEGLSGAVGFSGPLKSSEGIAVNSSLGHSDVGAAPQVKQHHGLGQTLPPPPPPPEAFGFDDDGADCYGDPTPHVPSRAHHDANGDGDYAEEDDDDEGNTSQPNVCRSYSSQQQQRYQQAADQQAFDHHHHHSASSSGMAGSKGASLQQVFGSCFASSQRVLTEPAEPLVPVTHSDGVTRCVDNEEGNLVIYVGMVLLGWLEVVSELGSGSFGQVVLCKDLRTVSNVDALYQRERDYKYYYTSPEFCDVELCQGSLVAVKVIGSNAVMEAQSYIEAQIMQELNNRPGGGEDGEGEEEEGDDYRRHFVCQILASGASYGHHCIAMERYACNLYEYLVSSSMEGLPISVVRAMAHQCLASLSYVHAKGYVHCDIKPENIMVKNEGQHCNAIMMTRPKESATVAAARRRDEAEGEAEGGGNKSPTPSDPSATHNEDADAPPLPPPLEIALIDFSSSCEHENTTFYEYIQSRYYRAPEAIIAAPYHAPMDIWSMGCVLAEMLIGRPLLPGANNFHQLNRIVEMFGPLPNSLLKEGVNTAAYYHCPPSHFEHSPTERGEGEGEEEGVGSHHMHPYEGTQRYTNADEEAVLGVDGDDEDKMHCADDTTTQQQGFGAANGDSLGAYAFDPDAPSHPGLQTLPPADATAELTRIVAAVEHGPADGADVSPPLGTAGHEEVSGGGDAVAGDDDHTHINHCVDTSISSYLQHRPSMASHTEMFANQHPTNPSPQESVIAGMSSPSALFGISSSTPCSHLVATAAGSPIEPNPGSAANHSFSQAHPLKRFSLVVGTNPPHEGGEGGGGIVTGLDQTGDHMISFGGASLSIAPPTSATIAAATSSGVGVDEPPAVGGTMDRPQASEDLLSPSPTLLLVRDQTVEYIHHGGTEEGRGRERDASKPTSPLRDIKPLAVDQLLPSEDAQQEKEGKAEEEDEGLAAAEVTPTRHAAGAMKGSLRQPQTNGSDASNTLSDGGGVATTHHHHHYDANTTIARPVATSSSNLNSPSQNTNSSSTLLHHHQHASQRFANHATTASATESNIDSPISYHRHGSSSARHHHRSSTNMSAKKDEERYTLMSEEAFCAMHGCEAAPWLRYLKYDTLQEIIQHLKLSEEEQSLSRKELVRQRKTLYQFLKAMLNVDPAKRWTADQLLQHPFITQDYTATATASASAISHSGGSGVGGRGGSGFASGLGPIGGGAIRRSGSSNNNTAGQ